MRSDFSVNQGFVSCRIFLTFIVLFFVSAVSYTPCFAKYKRTNVLILHSYHVGYKWTDDVHAGILSSLAPINAELDIHVEYMDMKRYFSEDRYQVIFHTLSDKYKYIPIDYIVSSDDAALLFLKKYGRALFPDAIVSFCGANYLDEVDLQGYPNFFGVTEEADIETNVQTLLGIHPDTEKIYVINDTTVTGQKVRKEVDRIIKKYAGEMEFILLEDISVDELIEQVAAIPPNSLVLFSLFLRDKYGHTFEYYDVITSVYDVSPVPIYGLWDFYFGHGLVGGMVTNGYSQGDTAGSIIFQLLKEGVSAEIQRVHHSPNRHIFDYNILKKHDINPKVLPPDSLVLNFPVSFYQKHRQVLIGSAFAILTLLVIIVILVFNIYLRKAAEKKLVQSEKNFRSIFENASEGLFQVTRDGTFIKVNPSLATILRCDSPDDVITTFSDIRNQLYVLPEERDQMLAALASGKRIINCERQLYCKDGTIITVLQNLHELRDETGRLLHLEGSITDITEQKKTESRLRQAQKMEAIGTLAGGIAHDFNNILSALIGYTQLALLEVAENSTIKNYLTEVEKASRRAKDLVSQILTISRKTESEKHPVKVSLIVTEALKLLRSSIPSSIEIMHNVESDSLIVADATEIHQVVMNLCTNAYQAMEENGGLLSISLRDCEFISAESPPDPNFSPGRYLHLEVSDTGAGMDEQTLTKVFEPYFTTKDPGSGTGLGLAVVNGIVSSCGGFIRIYSEPAHGTIFNIYFPVVIDVADSSLPLPQQQTRELKGGDETILLIDDEEDVLVMHSDLLRKFGYTVDSFDDSRKALTRFNANPARYSMIITDLTMPGLSGEKLGAEILSTHHDKPVVIISGFSGAMNRTKYIDQGYADFIQKPVDVSDFLHRIRLILDNQ